MTRYRIEYAAKSHRQLMAVPEPHRTRIVTAVDALAAQPRARGAIKLAGHDLYRIRVGEYRVVYAIHEKIVTVVVTGVGARDSIYRRL